MDILLSAKGFCSWRHCLCITKHLSSHHSQTLISRFFIRGIWRRAFSVQALPGKPHGCLKLRSEIGAKEAAESLKERKGGLELNDEQLSAVEIDAPYVRVIAGPGSGKTRVLTFRILHMIRKLNVDPSSILCLAFTDKAAKEIYERLNCPLEADLMDPLMVGTVHSVCSRILRDSMHTLNIGLDSDYSICDDTQSLNVVNRILKEAFKSCAEETCSVKKVDEGEYQNVATQLEHLDESQFALHEDLLACKFLVDGTPDRSWLLQYRPNTDGKFLSTVPSKLLLQEINNARSCRIKNFIAKSRGSFLHGFGLPPPCSDFSHKISKVYERELRRSGAVDFNDLLYLTCQMFHMRPHLLQKYRQQWSHVLVDEFQDIDDVQYEIIRLLASGNGSLFVVGDSDQAIYEWRGANPRYMQYALEKDFPEVISLQLLRNYRSSRNILNLASVLLKFIHGRKEILNHEIHHLLATKDQGEPICIKEFLIPQEEANFVASEIKSRWVDQRNFSDSFAVLYRTHQQSSLFEISLRQMGIPCTVVDGSSFFHHVEIKCVLAYLHLTCDFRNPDSMEYVLQRPRRGIGPKTISCLRDWILQQNLTLEEALQELCDKSDTFNEFKISKTARVHLIHFFQLIKGLQQMSTILPIDKLVEAIIERTGLRDYIKTTQKDAETSRKRLARLSYLKEFAGSVRKKYGIGISSPKEFIRDISLIQENELMGPEINQTVKLMTLHAAKGLEFDYVFIVGLEEGLLPVFNNNIAEERRLLYVGITRAKKLLCGKRYMKISCCS
ncbi:uncharacterized protein LOC18443651 isoform X2 [Amborella trichopoda]|uniref:uncharacterized protein LOC18443651 isoform X2 n=1 Tax=Amborella trichopoda TaxID=13333 RepID=UPI0009BE48C7|nr:uncharacterized protein LOC18443651 isoform X2 [Amborella trichopoda]|eukprot:XP_011626845.2 uncharacterized protein LOC18443651 isoform X2 [Amborella trichopoda]